MKIVISRHLLLAALSTGAFTLGLPAYAQPAADLSNQPTTATSEVIVTARKRSERLSDVPISITTASGDELRKLGVTDTSDLTKIAPGFTFTPSAYGPPVYAIRGIGFYDTIEGADPAVTVYVDQAPLPYSVMTRGAGLDLEQVEVLKGPQGTLFGQNSTGGAINYIAAKPTAAYRAGADLSYGSFNDVLTSGFVTGAVTDTVNVRLAASHESADGWQYSETRPGDALGKKAFSIARILVDWKPVNNLKFEMNATYWEDRGQSQAAQYEGLYPAQAFSPLTQFVQAALQAAPLAPKSARAADWDPGVDFSKHDDFYLLALRGDWDVSKYTTVTSITSYSDLRANDPIDLDGTAFTNFRYAQEKALLSSISEELRVAGTTDPVGALNPVQYTVGGIYQKEVANQNNVSDQLGSHNAVAGKYFEVLDNVNDQQPTTKAVFADLEYQLTSAISLQGSLRYTNQIRDFKGCLADDGAGAVGVSAGVPFSIFANALRAAAHLPAANVSIPQGGCLTLNAATYLPGLVKASDEQDNFSWKGGATWKPTPTTLLYANATKGFKAGGYTLVPAVLSNQEAPIKQESVIAYEGGVKQQLFGRLVDVTGAVFYYDYTNKQLTGQVAVPVFVHLPSLINIPTSHVYGGEISVVVRPISGLIFNGGATYTASKVTSNPVGAGETIDPLTGAATSYIGEAFPDTPKWTATADTQYTRPISATLDGFIGGGLTYRSSSNAAFGDEPLFKLNSYTLLDLRIGVESPGGKWRAQLWAKNLTNVYYWNNVTHVTDTLDRLAGMPETYGISLSYRH